MQLLDGACVEPGGSSTTVSSSSGGEVCHAYPGESCSMPSDCCQSGDGIGPISEDDRDHRQHALAPGQLVEQDRGLRPLAPRNGLERSQKLDRRHTGFRITPIAAALAPSIPKKGPLMLLAPS